MKEMLRKVWRLLIETVQEWRSDKAARLAAALAYYTTFSMAPLLVVVIAVAGLAFDQNAVQDQIEYQLTSLMGAESVELVATMIGGARRPSAGFLASTLAILALVLGATGVFLQLRDALNTAWEVEPRPSLGIRGIVESRVVSFAMVLCIGFLLLVSLVVSASIASVTEMAGGPGPLGYLARGASFVASFLLITVLFAMMFKILPDAEVQWRDVWVGAAVTAFLFNLGKFLIGTYLGRSDLASTYGSAAALAIFLVWIYYSAQIFLLGAEFTQVYARHFGSRIRPDENAVATEPDSVDRPRAAPMAATVSR